MGDRHIDLTRLILTDIGRKVVYTDGVGNRTEGEITSWNHRYVFVKFKGPNGEACDPADVWFSVGSYSE